MPEQHDAGQPLADEVRRDADARDEPEDAPRPSSSPPATSTGRGPDPLARWLVGPGDGSGDERARRQREARLEHRVVPHAR